MFKMQSSQFTGNKITGMLMYFIYLKYDETKGLLTV